MALSARIPIIKSVCYSKSGFKASLVILEGAYMPSEKTLRFIAYILVLVGAINWGLVGLAGLNLVGAILGGPMSLLARLVYIIVGVAGGYLIYLDYFKKETPAQ